MAKQYSIGNVTALYTAGISLPYHIDGETARATMRAAFDAGSLQRQQQLARNVAQGNAQYAGAYGPCVVGAVIPPALGAWIDAGNVRTRWADGSSQPTYTVSDLIAAGVLSVDNDEDAEFLHEAQTLHDGGTYHSLKRLGILLHRE